MPAWLEHALSPDGKTFYISLIGLAATLAGIFWKNFKTAAKEALVAASVPPEKNLPEIFERHSAHITRTLEAVLGILREIKNSLDDDRDRQSDIFRVIEGQNRALSRIEETAERMGSASREQLRHTEIAVAVLTQIRDMQKRDG